MDGKESQRNKLYDLLGKLPNRSSGISTDKIYQVERECYILEKLVLDLNGIENVPAYFVRPHNINGPLPTILYNHAHGMNYALGKDELLLGRSSLQPVPYAEALTSNGYAALCFDTWGFGERSGRTESEIFKEMLWTGRVMWGMMIYDSIRAIDYLVSRSDVDQDRIGTIGISMGSSMAWWLAALDTRIKVCIDICCLTDFQMLIETKNLDEHGIYYYIPNLLNHFTTAQINSLIAPRPHLSLAGNNDPLTPPAGLDRINSELIDAYRMENSSDAWNLKRYDTGHFETSDMRAEVFLFFNKWLC